MRQRREAHQFRPLLFAVEYLSVVLLLRFIFSIIFFVERWYFFLKPFNPPTTRPNRPSKRTKICSILSSSVWFILTRLGSNPTVSNRCPALVPLQTYFFYSLRIPLALLTKDYYFFYLLRDGKFLNGPKRKLNPWMWWSKATNGAQKT